MKKKLLAVFFGVMLICGSSGAVRYMGIDQVYMVSGAGSEDSTHTLSHPTQAFTLYAYGDTVSFVLYNRRGSFITSITVPNGASWSSNGLGPMIKKVQINRPSTKPLAWFVALQ
jgi:hypothetical protein